MQSPFPGIESIMNQHKHDQAHANTVASSKAYPQPQSQPEPQSQTQSNALPNTHHRHGYQPHHNSHSPFDQYRQYQPQHQPNSPRSVQPPFVKTPIHQSANTKTPTLPQPVQQQINIFQLSDFQSLDKLPFVAPAFLITFKNIWVNFVLNQLTQIKHFILQQAQAIVDSSQQSHQNTYGNLPFSPANLTANVKISGSNQISLSTLSSFNSNSNSNIYYQAFIGALVLYLVIVVLKGLFGGSSNSSDKTGASNAATSNDSTVKMAMKQLASLKKQLNLLKGSTAKALQSSLEVINTNNSSINNIPRSSQPQPLPTSNLPNPNALIQITQLFQHYQQINNQTKQQNQKLIQYLLNKQEDVFTELKGLKKKIKKDHKLLKAQKQYQRGAVAKSAIVAAGQQQVQQKRQTPQYTNFNGHVFAVDRCSRQPQPRHQQYTHINGHVFAVDRCSRQPQPRLQQNTHFNGHVQVVDRCSRQPQPRLQQYAVDRCSRQPQPQHQQYTHFNGNVFAVDRCSRQSQPQPKKQELQQQQKKQQQLNNFAADDGLMMHQQQQHQQHQQPQIHQQQPNQIQQYQHQQKQNEVSVNTSAPTLIKPGPPPPPKPTRKVKSAIKAIRPQPKALIQVTTTTTATTATIPNTVSEMTQKQKHQQQQQHNQQQEQQSQSKDSLFEQQRQPSQQQQNTQQFSSDKDFNFNHNANLNGHQQIQQPQPQHFTPSQQIQQIEVIIPQPPKKNFRPPPSNQSTRKGPGTGLGSRKPGPGRAPPPPKARLPVLSSVDVNYQPQGQEAGRQNEEK